MSSAFSRFALAAAAALSMAACRDSDLAAPNRARQLPAATNMRLGNPIIAITAGAYHTCTVRQNGAAACWGYDQDGQLGIGAAPALCGGGYRCADVSVPIPNLAFRDLSAGWSHTCGVALDNTVWCWGANNAYQLGTNDHAASDTPRQIYGGGGYANSVSAGTNLTCGTSTGSLWCFGTMPDGKQLPVAKEIRALNYSAAYLAVRAGLTDNFGVHVCGYWYDQTVSADPRLDCWGNNRAGEVNVSPTVATYVPPYKTIGVVPRSFPAVGDGFTCVDVTNGVACLGTDAEGQLGNSAYLGKQSPNPIMVERYLLHGVVAGDHHACALDPSYNAFCWGLNDFLQVGSTKRDARIASPVMVGGGHQFTALAAGANHTCGIDIYSHVWCWGDDYFGQLGDRQQFRQVYGSNQSELPILVIGT